jgi:hypothetical protein
MRRRWSHHRGIAAAQPWQRAVASARHLLSRYPPRPPQLGGFQPLAACPSNGAVAPKAAVRTSAMEQGIDSKRSLGVCAIGEPFERRRARGGEHPKQAMDQHLRPQLGRQADRPWCSLPDAAESDLPRRHHPQRPALPERARGNRRRLCQFSPSPPACTDYLGRQESMATSDLIDGSISPARQITHVQMNDEPERPPQPNLVLRDTTQTCRIARCHRGDMVASWRGAPNRIAGSPHSKPKPIGEKVERSTRCTTGLTDRF